MFRYPFIKQHDEKDCGAAVVSMLSKYWGLSKTFADIRTLVRTDINGTTMYGLSEGLTKLGFIVDGLQGDISELLDSVKNKEVKLPFIARIVKDEILEHFIVVYKINRNEIVVGDPALGIIKYKMEHFVTVWTGHIINATPSNEFKPTKREKSKFGQYIHILFKQKKMLVWAITMSLLISVISIGGAMAFYIVIEEISNSGNIENMTGINVGIVFSIILILYLFRAILSILRGNVLALLSKKIENDILLSSYDKLLNGPISFFESRSTGEIMSRFDDITEICNAISGGALTIFLDTITGVITGSILFSINKSLSIWAMLIVLLYIFSMIVFKKPIIKYNNAVMESNAIITSIIKQTVDGISILKSYCNLHAKKTFVSSEYDRYAKSKMKAAMIEVVQNSLVGFIAVGGSVLVLWKGMDICLQGLMSLSMLITYYNILDYFFNSITNLVTLQSDIETAVISAERLNDILECSDENNNADNNREFLNGDIEFRNVSFRYGGGIELFDDLNLKIPKGEKIAIIGESGSGKSTVAKLMAGFYPLDSGMITIDKVPLDSFSYDTIRKHIMYIPESGIMFEDTIKNNIILYNNVSDETVIEVCKILQIDDFIQSLPYGYETLIDESGSVFSTGQRQKINIARALIHKPDILILDEATCNLDPISEKTIHEAINKLCKKTTCILIAHKLSTIQDCNQIIIMEAGKISQIGSHKEFVSNNPFYMNYLI